jgi:hypothetical protein
VFVPDGASVAKVGLIEAEGAELHRAGADVDEAKAAARAYAAERDAFFFEDGAEPAQFVGYEAIADELLDELPEPAAVVVPVGNGALAVGIFRALARRAPDARRVAVAAEEAPAMWQGGGPTLVTPDDADLRRRPCRSGRDSGRGGRAERPRAAVRTRFGAKLGRGAEYATGIRVEGTAAAPWLAPRATAAALA